MSALQGYLFLSAHGHHYSGLFSSLLLFAVLLIFICASRLLASPLLYIIYPNVSMKGKGETGDSTDDSGRTCAFVFCDSDSAELYRLGQRCSK